jgi:hypothetical protein
MHSPKFGKQRSISGAISSLSKKLPGLSLPKSAPPPSPRPKPNFGKPRARTTGEGRRK